MPDLALLGCCLVYLHFMCDILSGQPVEWGLRSCVFAAFLAHDTTRAEYCGDFMQIWHRCPHFAGGKSYATHVGRF